MAVLPAEKDQRQLSPLDIRQIRLDQGRPLAGEAAEALLVLAGHHGSGAPGFERGRRDARLHHHVAPAARAGQVGERGLVALGHPGGGDHLDAGVGEIAQVALVRVPPEQRDRVEDARALGGEPVEPGVELAGTVVVVPARAHHDGGMARPRLRGVVPEAGHRLEAGLRQHGKQQAVVGRELRVGGAGHQRDGPSRRTAHPVNRQCIGASAPRVPSTGHPSWRQYSRPPIISFTRKPRRASLAAALVEALQAGPQQ